MSFSVTWAVPGDIAEIMRLEEEAFSPLTRESRDVFLERLERFPRGNTVLIFPKEPGDSGGPGEVPGGGRKLGGYFCSELWDDVPPLSRASYELGHNMAERHCPEGKVLYISSFAADRRLRGAGRPLFRESLCLIRRENPGIDRAVLAVNENWPAARHIYETEGFVYTGRLEKFFEDRHAALIMECIYAAEKS